MSNPSIDELIANLRERIVDAKEEADESHKAAMNSYGAGYDSGYLDALEEILADATGERP